MSALTENGTYIDLAKIEGSDTYKAYMRDSTQAPRHSTVVTKYCPFPRSICERYWPFRVIQPHSSLKPIIQALVTAAESTLEQPVHSVFVTAHRRSTITRDDVLSALDDIGVYGWRRVDQVISHQIWALHLAGRCPDPWLQPEHPEYHEDPPKLILSVEYTRQSLVLGVWEEDCGIGWMLGFSEAHELGYDSRKFCRQLRADKSGCDGFFTRAIGKALSSEKVNTYRSIDAVLLTGENAHDKDIQTLLRQVLTDRFPNSKNVDLFRVRALSDDPTYAGSRAAAWAELGAKDLLRDRQQHGYEDEL